MTKDSRYTSVPTSSVTRKPTPDGPKKHTSRGHAPRSKQNETSEWKEEKKKSNEGGDPQWIVSQPLPPLSIHALPSFHLPGIARPSHAGASQCRTRKQRGQRSRSGGIARWKPIKWWKSRREKKEKQNMIPPPERAQYRLPPIVVSGFHPTQCVVFVSRY